MEATASFDRRIKDRLKQGTAERSEIEQLLQQVESVKQAAQLLSLRSKASRNGRGSPDARSTDSAPSVNASSG